MAELDPQETVFVAAYLKSNNASEAYRRCNPKAAKWKPQSVHVKASEMLARDTVQVRLRQLQDKVEAKGLLSLEEHMEELKSLREMSKQNGQLSAAITAEVKRGELRKFYVKQVESGAVGEFARAPDDELDEFIVSEVEDLGLTAKAKRPANGHAKH